eukprot:15361113-Ditylum_brightwellii.AAC.1
MADALGRTPLHILAANEELALTSTIQDAQLLIEEMIVSNATCVTSQCLLEGKRDTTTFKSNQLVTIIAAKVPLDFAKLTLN